MARSIQLRPLRHQRPVLIVACALLATVAPMRATYSIVATDPMTGQCGVAVQTDNLAVGASVPYARAGVGAIASQFETNPRHGPRGLELLAQGKDPADIVQQLLREDGNFEGRGPEARQVAVVSSDGRVAVHTGTDAAQADWAGSRFGRGYSVQGNSLAGPQVLAAMERAYLSTSGPLAERLLAALTAGDHAGGQRTGRQSAALLVRTQEGFPLDIDLRVDDSPDPVGGLIRLHDLSAARQQIIQARILARNDNIGKASVVLDAAVQRAHDWPRALLLAAEVAAEIEQPALARQWLSRAFQRNPAWIPSTLGRGTFAALGSDPDFARWFDASLTNASLDAYRSANTAPQTSDETLLAVASRLLEAGHAAESLVLLRRVVLPTPASHLLTVTAYQALGQTDAARAQCQAGLRLKPDDQRLALRLATLQAALKSP